MAASICSMTDFCGEPSPGSRWRARRLAVQLAKHHYGAEVTGVCGTLRLDYVKALGADQVIDYKKQDFTQNGETYDVIFDVLGRVLFTRTKSSLIPEGILLYASFKGRNTRASTC